jgi:hypothetical protein
LCRTPFSFLPLAFVPSIQSRRAYERGSATAFFAHRCQVIVPILSLPRWGFSARICIFRSRRYRIPYLLDINRKNRIHNLFIFSLPLNRPCPHSIGTSIALWFGRYPCTKRNKTPKQAHACLCGRLSGALSCRRCCAVRFGLTCTIGLVLPIEPPKARNLGRVALLKSHPVQTKLGG